MCFGHALKRNVLMSFASFKGLLRDYLTFVQVWRFACHSDLFISVKVPTKPFCVNKTSCFLSVPYTVHDRISMAQLKRESSKLSE